MKSTLLFLATFLLGAVIAFATRTALHEPYAATGSADFQPAPSAPAGNAELPLGTPLPAPDPHAAHASSPASAPGVTVNTICPICAMDVDPDLKSATYQGKLVGFGCAACPPRFAKDPDRYGPSALLNEVAKN